VVAQRIHALGNTKVNEKGRAMLSKKLADMPSLTLVFIALSRESFMNLSKEGEVEAYCICKYPEFMIYEVNGKWRLHIEYTPYAILPALESLRGDNE